MKILNKIQPKISRKTSGPWNFAGWLGDALAGGIPVDPTLIIGEYYGEVSDDGSLLLSMTGNHTGFGQMKGSAFKGDGTNYGTYTTPVIVHGIEFYFYADSAQTLYTTLFYSGTSWFSDDMFLLRLSDADNLVLVVNADGLTSSNGITAARGQVNKVVVERTPTGYNLSVNDSTVTLATSAYISSSSKTNVAADQNGSGVPTLKIWGLKTYQEIDGVKTLNSDLPMICLGSGTEWSSTEGLPDCVWNPPVAVQLPAQHNANDIDPGAFYEVFTDGRGSNRSNVDGFSVGTEGPELWNDPTTQTVDANNYSTYDAETGICRIVSNGTWVDLRVNDSLIDGGSYSFTYTEISNLLGSVTLASLDSANDLTEGSEVIDGTASTTHNIIKRTGACDVTFRLSVKQSGLEYIVPAAEVQPPQYPGPIAADMTLGGIGIQGDGVRYVDIPGLLTTDTIIGDATCTTNGRLDIANATVCHSVTVERAGEEWAFYPMEDGQPGEAVSKVEDVKGGNHGTIIEPVAAQLPATPEDPYPIQRALETAWVQTEVGPCYRMAGGYNLDKEVPDLLTNGDFSDGTNGWSTANDPSFTVSNGDATIGFNGTNYCRIYEDITADLPAGSNSYYIIEVISVQGTWNVALTTNANGGLTVPSTWKAISAPGTYESALHTSGNVTSLSITASTNQAGDYIVVRTVKVDKLTLGYSCEDMNNSGYDVDGDPIQWKANQYDTFLNAGVLVQGSLGPETQALTSWTGEQWQDINTLPFNVDDQEFYCDKGIILLNAPADQEQIDGIGSRICSAYEPNLLINGGFTANLDNWDVLSWTWNDGKASPLHLTSNTLKQTVDMQDLDSINLEFSYNLDSDAVLYVKVGNPSGVNDIVINGPASDIYIGVEISKGDTIQFSITSIANPSNNWIDSARILK